MSESKYSRLVDLPGIFGAVAALAFALFSAFSVISGRSGGSDENPYSLSLALLMACLPAAGAVLAVLAARRAVTPAPAKPTVYSWLLVPSFACSIFGLVALTGAWGYLS